MIDALTHVLNALRLKSSVYCRSEISTVNWSLLFNATPCAAFHVVEQGQCVLQIEATDETILLNAGDFLMLPHGDSHFVSQQMNTPPMIAIQLDEAIPQGVEIKQYLGQGEFTALVCGIFDFEHRNRYPLIAFMLRVIHIQAAQAQQAGLDAILRLIGKEAASARPGMETLLKRLADVLFVQVVRFWIDNPENEVRGWIGAMRDSQIGHSLNLIHGCPERDWTVASLAREVAMSRSAYAARFTELVGEAPFQYLTRWRMQTAMQLLDQEDLPLIAIAERVGYESEAAFHKAFKRTFGINPGMVRRNFHNAKV